MLSKPRDTFNPHLQSLRRLRQRYGARSSIRKRATLDGDMCLIAVELCRHQLAEARNLLPRKNSFLCEARCQLRKSPPDPRQH